MSKDKNYDPKQVLNTAHSFLVAAQVCAEPRHISENTFQFLAVPSVVNAAFSCELSIKAILNRYEIPIPRGNEGHKIDILFSLLPNELQAKIKTTVNTPTFCPDLQTISNSFVDWRYVFELNSATIPFAFLMTLAQTIYQEAEILITRSSH